MEENKFPQNCPRYYDYIQGRDDLNSEGYTAIDNLAIATSTPLIDLRNVVHGIFAKGGMARTEKGIELYNHMVECFSENYALISASPLIVSAMTLNPQMRQVLESDRISKVMDDLEQLKSIVKFHNLLNRALQQLSNVKDMMDKARTFLEVNTNDLIDVSSIDLTNDNGQFLTEAIQSENLKMVKSLLVAGFRVFKNHLYYACPARVITSTNKRSQEAEDIFNLLMCYIGNINQIQYDRIFKHLKFYNYSKEENILASHLLK